MVGGGGGGGGGGGATGADCVDGFLSQDACWVHVRPLPDPSRSLLLGGTGVLYLFRGKNNFRPKGGRGFF